MANIHREHDGLHELRREATYYLFMLFGMPPDEHWGGLDIVKEIILRLLYPEGSNAIIRKILRDILDCESRGERYSAKTCLQNKKDYIISNESQDAKIIYEAMKQGLSSVQATFIVNVHRESKGRECICHSTVYRFLKSSPFVDICIRTVKKAGKSDPTTKWAIARRF